MLWTLFLLEKYETNIDDVGGKRRWNILQWSKNNFKSKINTNGDYFSWSTFQPKIFWSPILLTLRGC